MHWTLLTHQSVKGATHGLSDCLYPDGQYISSDDTFVRVIPQQARRSFDSGDGSCTGFPG